ncbi:MAG: cysteine desulfurase [Planctomycetes bacterium]|nr:cysteine desulfurase [Planctomycetota bacterium]
MNAAETVYLDHNASTPILPAAFEAMLPFLREGYANPSAIHVAGENLRRVLEEAREVIAGLLGARPAEICFSSGATEAINQALRGVLEARPRRRKLVISAAEHAATRDVAAQLERRGHPVQVVPVDARGELDEDELDAALDDEAAILSLLWVNNETGVVTDVARHGRLAHERGVVFHVDAAQKVGKGMPALGDLPIDLLSFSAHKFGGPKGVGALYVRRGVSLRPLIWGAHHEGGRRGGTENLPGIVGMAVALEQAVAAWPVESRRLRALRDAFEAALRADHPDMLVNGAGAPRNENTLNVAFRGIEGHGVVLRLAQRGVYCSSGSACTAHDPGPSHVLAAMGLPGDHIHGALRFSLGAGVTVEGLARTRLLVGEAVAALAGQGS